MTENEAIEKLKIFPEWNKVDEWLSVAAMQELVDTCIEAFKENQRYRALGKVEFLSDMKNHYVEVLSDLRQYQKIGTVEECREAIERRKEKKIAISHSGDKDNGKALCPNCGTDIHGIGQIRYCFSCGQKLRWNKQIQNLQKKTISATSVLKKLWQQLPELHKEGEKN